MSLFNLMVDTESMGTEPMAPLVSIGAVFFDEHTGQVGETFYRKIHLSTAVRLGFAMEPAAVLWWMQQPDEARISTFSMAEDVRVVMAEFAEWINTKCPGKDELRVWGCSPAFDCIKLTEHFKACGIETPWKCYNERCYRTIRERNKNVPEADRSGLHNALEDAMHQARHLIAIRQHHAQKAAA